MTPATRTVSAAPSGSAVSRYLICRALGRGLRGAIELAEATLVCREVPQVLGALQLEEKAAIAPGGTADTTWAGALAGYGISREAWELLQSASIFGRLSSRFRRTPFRVQMPQEMSAGAGSAWTAQGVPTPVTRGLYSTVTLDFLKLQSLVLLTYELMKFGATSEQTIRQSLINAAARGLDEALLDPANTGGSGAPASLTSTCDAISSSGATAANILADLDLMLAQIGTPGDGLVWVGRPTLFARVAGKLAAIGVTPTPGYLLGVPIVAGSTSPAAQLVLIDCASVVAAFDEGVALDASVQANIEAADAALSSTGSATVSLFQTKMAALRSTVAANWATVEKGTSPTEPAGIALLTGIAY
jgi:hypothetical protein